MVQKIYFRYISMSSYKKHSGKKKTVNGLNPGIMS